MKKKIILSFIAILGGTLFGANLCAKSVYAKWSDNLYDVYSIADVMDELSAGANIQLGIAEMADGGYVTAGVYLKNSHNIHIYNCRQDENAVYGDENLDNSWRGVCDVDVDGEIYPDIDFGGACSATLLSGAHQILETGDIPDDAIDLTFENRITIYDADDNIVKVINQPDYIFNSVDTDAEGNIYALGITSGSIATYFNEENRDYDDTQTGYVFKYDKNGRLLDTIEVENPNSEEQTLVRMAVFDNGDYAILGIRDIAAENINWNGDREIFISKFNYSGELLWTKDFGAILSDGTYGYERVDGPVITDIEPLSDGGIAVAGFTMEINGYDAMSECDDVICVDYYDLSTYFENGTYESVGVNGVMTGEYIAKFNENGDREWKYSYHDNGGIFLSVHELSNGNIVAGGLRKQDSKLQSSLSKFGAEGEEVWQTAWYDEVEEPLGSCIFDFIELENGDLYTVGLSYGEYTNYDEVIIKMILADYVNPFDTTEATYLEGQIADELSDKILGGEPLVVRYGEGDYTGDSHKNIAILFSGDGNYLGSEYLDNQANGYQVVLGGDGNAKVLEVKHYYAKAYTPTWNITPFTHVLSANTDIAIRVEEEEEEEIKVPDTGRNSQENTQIIIGIISGAIAAISIVFVIAKNTHQRAKSHRSVSKFTNE